MGPVLARGVVCGEDYQPTCSVDGLFCGGGIVDVVTAGIGQNRGALARWEGDVRQGCGLFVDGPAGLSAGGEHVNHLLTAVDHDNGPGVAVCSGSEQVARPDAGGRVSVEQMDQRRRTGR